MSYNKKFTQISLISGPKILALRPEKDHDDENNPIFILVHLHRKESDELCKEPLVHVFIHLVEDEPVSDAKL